MKKIVIYIFVMLLLSSCAKNEPANRNLTIEGTLMAGCNTPAANRSGYFHYNGGMTQYDWAEFTTDANGYFKVTEEIGGSNLTLNVGRGPGVLRNIALLGRNHLDLGKVYINPPIVSYYLHLKVNNAYTELDTLHYRNAGYPYNEKEPWLKKAGPFSSGIIDTVPIASNLNALPITFRSNNVPRIKLSYYMNEYDSWNDHDKFIYISTPHCVEEYQNITLVID